MPIWWEKTVEYKFILWLSKENNGFLAPLDGDHERAGDTLISLNCKWLLIEFKRDRDSTLSEIKKFKNYENARAALSARDGHHFLVFGKPSDGNQVDLYALTYFSLNGTTDLKAILSAGTNLEDFSKYVESFVAFKKDPKSGGNSGARFEDYAMVAGVSEEGNVVTCMSLQEFGLARGIELTKEIQKTLSRGGPSR